MEQRDTWYKAEVIAQIIGAIFIPFALFYVGAQYEAQQDLKRQSESRVNRLTSLIEHLSSSSPRERKLAFAIANYLMAQKQLPEKASGVLAIAATLEEDQDAKETIDFKAVIQEEPKN